MRLGAIRYLIADPRSELKAPAIAQLRFHGAGEAKEDVALFTPVIREIPGRVFDHANANGAELLRTPQRDAGFAGVLGGFDGAPVGDAKGEVGDLHRRSSCARPL